MKLGAFEIYPVTDGRFRLDGGAMFGVVPKMLWQKCCPADDMNRVPLSLTCLLIRAHGRNILVDTGLGDKEDAKFQSMFAIERTPTLRESLRQRGVAPDDIHLVINTHLHFDHAGGNTSRRGDQLSSTFPKAAYCVQRGEYEDAARANERTRASYRRDNFTPIAHVNQWEFLSGDTGTASRDHHGGHGRPYPLSSKREDRIGRPDRVFLRRSDPDRLASAAALHHGL